MKVRAPIILALLASGFLGCAHVPDEEPVIGPPPSMSMTERSKFERVIRDYLAREKRWAPEEYSVGLSGAYDGIVVFKLTHRDDGGPLASAGGGKSAELHIAAWRKKVLREIGYQ